MVFQSKEERLEEKITMLILEQRALPNPKKTEKIKDYSQRYYNLTGHRYKFPYEAGLK